MKRKKHHQKAKPTKPRIASPHHKAPIIEHVHELRKRLFFIAVSVSLWGTAAYFVEHQIVEILLKPAKGQHFIYTSPIGGLDFLFKLCIYAGIVMSIPVIIYNLLRYLEPLMERHTKAFVYWGSFVSGILAVAGMVFGYFIGLPAALHFLLHQFTTNQIEPLLTIQSYTSFVAFYMFGAALMFQVPLIILFINRIKPLKPQRLFHYERWVILFAFVLAGLMNPSPNVSTMLLIAGPIIITYQISILLIWFENRKLQNTTATPNGRKPASMPKDVPKPQNHTAHEKPQPQPKKAAPIIPITPTAPSGKVSPTRIRSRHDVPAYTPRPTLRQYRTRSPQPQATYMDFIPAREQSLPSI